jgi:hypothetical protein
MPRKKILSADFDQFSPSITDSILDTLAAHPSKAFGDEHRPLPEPHERQERGSSVAYATVNHRPRMEDTCTRQTFLIRNDLIERLNRIAATQKKGFKTRFMNYVLEKELDELNTSGET